MSKQSNDDLFKDTTMTFGEHLEELRGSLFRALVGLVVAFLLGLLVAKHVVNFIKTPLAAALERYHAKIVMRDLTLQYGEELPSDLAEFINSNRVACEEVYFEQAELERISAAFAAQHPAAQKQTSRAAPSVKEEVELPPPDPRLMKTRIWRSLSSKITALSAQEAFMIWLKAAFVTGLLIASPYIFWELWGFIAAGLYPHEKRYVHIYLPFSLVLFWSGAALAFFAVFRYVLDFLLAFNISSQIEAEPRIGEWMSFVLFMPLGFGIAFQLPLVMLFLNRITIFSIEAYLEKWRIAVLVIFILSMFLTPADPVSMLLMAAPLCALYFLGIVLCKWMPRGKSLFDGAYEA